MPPLSSDHAVVTATDAELAACRDSYHRQTSSITGPCLRHTRATAGLAGALRTWASCCQNLSDPGQCHGYRQGPWLVASDYCVSFPSFGRTRIFAWLAAAANASCDTSFGCWRLTMGAF